MILLYSSKGDPEYALKLFRFSRKVLVFSEAEYAQIIAYFHHLNYDSIADEILSIARDSNITFSQDSMQLVREAKVKDSTGTTSLPQNKTHFVA